MKITVIKSKRVLICSDGDRVLLRAHVQLGKNADMGAKRAEGDLRTPEGTYQISSKNPASRYHLSLGLSYPNPSDAARGLNDGIISAEQYALIVSNPSKPPWDTPLGGFIMIHGKPDERTVSGDWTAGCIAIENEKMDILYPIAQIGDIVEILP